MAAVNVPVKGLTGLINIITLDTANTIAQVATAASTAEGLTSSYYEVLPLERDPDYNSVDTPTATLASLNFVGASGTDPDTDITEDTDIFYFKPLQTGQTKQYLQEQRTNIAQLKRKGGTSGNVSLPCYRSWNSLDLSLLPATYVGNVSTPNSHPAGLVEGRPWGEYDINLFRYTYSGYFADDPAWFASQTATASTDDGTLAVNPLAITTSYQWIGYFVPTTTESYTFYTTSDDASFLWIGPNAVTGFTTANALVNNAGEHPAQEQSGSIALTAGQYYPIRIQAGNNGGPGEFSTAFSTLTITKTSTFTGYLFYEPDTGGF
jgi:hypothetical protein